MANALIRYEVAASGVATIALDQPETRNALSPELLGELHGALLAAREDPAVRVVVLTSTHEKVFSSGGNLAGFAAEEPERLSAAGGARQAVDLRGQRARAGGRAGAGTGL
jgi:enoyl-CoA hydratase